MSTNVEGNDGKLGTEGPCVIITGWRWQTHIRYRCIVHDWDSTKRQNADAAIEKQQHLLEWVDDE